MEYVADDKPRGVYNFSERFPMNDCLAVDMTKMKFESQNERDAFRMYLSRLGFRCTSRNVFTKEKVEPDEQSS